MLFNSSSMLHKQGGTQCYGFSLVPRNLSIQLIPYPRGLWVSLYTDQPLEWNRNVEEGFPIRDRDVSS